ncbi:ribonucleoside-diphosphate reductase subunit alpha [bacterium]|nr:ribonucleoside-diphosphate reductase subunit alpha [bacterium]
MFNICSKNIVFKADRYFSGKMTKESFLAGADIAQRRMERSAKRLFADLSWPGSPLWCPANSGLYLRAEIQNHLDQSGMRYIHEYAIKIMSVETAKIIHIIKRSGKRQKYTTNKIVRYLNELIQKRPRLDHVDISQISKRATLTADMTTVALAEHIAEVCAAMTVRHWEYGALGGRAVVAMLHRQTPSTFTEAMCSLKDILDPQFVACCVKHQTVFNEMIDNERDFQYGIMGIRTLQRSYLLKLQGIIVERPQYMLLRVAVALHKEDLSKVKETYEATSRLMYTHATPTLFHAGMRKQQLASCFLMTMTSDSIEGIFETLKRCALISKGAGGIGLSCSNIRASGTAIRGTNGQSNGLTPMLRVFNDTARYVDQGGGRRKGSFAIFLEPHHPDILDFLELKKNHGVDAEKARDLFYGLWISDLFMERVKAGKQWSVICPTQCPQLQDAVGDDYKRLYEECESKGLVLRSMPARQLWFAILDAQIETGTPYMMYKDHCNRKSNQQSLGTIRGSNLCCEIVEYTSPDEAAVCTLASISLTACTRPEGIDFAQLERVARLVTRNLNKTIDANYYPIEQARRSNLQHRPIGIGVQGFADALAIMAVPYESAKARALNKQIFETIYYGALDESVELAKRDGPYASFQGSPFSHGKMQFDLWGVLMTDERHPWSALREKLVRHGARNSLLTAPMPTASTASIMGNTESFEPRTSNLYTRRVLSGEYIVINRYLQSALEKRGLWSEEMSRALIQHRGSVQNIATVPQDIKDVYKTVWEISQRTVIDMAAERGCFIDQSQSMNIHLEEPSRAKLTSVHFHSWQKGLKTGMYYLRTQPKAKALQFTCSIEKPVVKEDEDECMACSA